MRHGHLALIGLFMFAAGTAAPLAQTGQITGVVVAAREQAGNDSLLLRAPTTVQNQPIDQVRVELPQRLISNVRPGLLPAGWVMQPGAGFLSFTGPAQARADGLFIRLGLGDRDAPDNLVLKLFANNRLLYDSRHAVARFPRINFTEPIDDLLDLPGRVSPGETITFTVRDETLFRRFGLDTYGEWRIGGNLAYKLPEEPPAGGADAGKPAAPNATPGSPVKYGADLSHELDTGLRLSVGYRTKWDELVVDYPRDASPETVPEPRVPPLGPSIINCSPKAFAGNRICVCGWFPDEASRNGLMIDGQPLGAASGGSNQSVRVELPAELTPGRHVITGNNVAGSAEIVVVQLAGEVDQDQLFRGQSTPLRMKVIGTEDVMRITLTNKTPGIIEMSGGNQQVISTSGGPDNRWEGTVRGVKVGNFNIVYNLDLTSCPCNEQDLALASSQPTGETIFDDTFGSFRRARDLTDDSYDSGEPGGDDPRDVAQDALDELERTRTKLQSGVDAWNKGDRGGVGPTAAATFTRLIGELETRARAVRDLPEEVPPADDPRDEPPPTIYGEEIDAPWISVNDGSFAPSQGVWQDDDYFDDKATKRMTRVDPTAWNAELDMVANRYTRIFGIRDDGHVRVKMSGKTTYSRLAPVRFQFKLIQGGKETIIWTQQKAENFIPIDGDAGPEGTWGASLMTPEGVDSSFLMDPGSYTLEMELIRESGAPTGLKIKVTGDVVQTSFPTVSIVPVLLGDDTAAGMHALAEDVHRLTVESQDELPALFPVPQGGVNVVAQYIQDLSDQELGTMDRLISLLPGTDTSENVRRDRMVATMVQRFATGATLNGGGKVVVVMNDRDFAMTDRRHEGIGGYAPHAKVLVLKMGKNASTVAHELIHSIPFSWADEGMVAECGRNYHNFADNDYGNGVRIWSYFGSVRKNVNAVMGPVSGFAWITQCSYWHLLNQLQGAVDPELYLVRGFVARRDGQNHGVLAPTYEMEDVGELAARPLEPNGWGIVLRDRAGQALATYPFQVTWRDADAGEDRSLVAFNHRIDRVPGTATIELVGPGGRKDIQTVSANTPTVEITSPTQGRVVTPANGRITVEWRAADADGDALSYLVFYSPDGGRSWRPLADEQREPRIELDIMGRPAAPRVRVIATDGVRSATAEVGFTIAR